METPILIGSPALGCSAAGASAGFGASVGLGTSVGFGASVGLGTSVGFGASTLGASVGAGGGVAAGWQAVNSTLAITRIENKNTNFFDILFSYNSVFQISMVGLTKN
jgi:hypothetical protein